MCYQVIISTRKFQKQQVNVNKARGLFCTYIEDICTVTKEDICSVTKKIKAYFSLINTILISK